METIVDRTAPATSGVQAQGVQTPARKAKEAAIEFESVFLAEFMKTLVSGSENGSGPFSGPFASLMIDEYAKLISASGGIGLADHVQAEIVRIQESSG